jgi:23S rRNA (pseudouridine1915-N3)-methyltransferase
LALRAGTRRWGAFRPVDILEDVQFTLVHIGPRPPARDAFDDLTRMYMERMSPYFRCASAAYRDEPAFFEAMTKEKSRTAPVLVLLDSRGKALTSEAFAQWIGVRRDEGAQNVVFAIGPASGWSDEGRKRANLLLSFGSMTLAHALARLVMAEQLYRACTILAGHPYHTGH